MAKPPSHQQTWNELGTWWDENIGDDGDEFHRRLIHPNIFKLLAESPKGRVLDAGCGNGALSRKLAADGYEVLGIDVSETLLEGANRRTDATRFPKLSYKKIDLTSERELSSLPSKSFDSIVCSMVMHDIPQVNPLFEMVNRCLTDTGCFIFSIPHPCFNSPYTKCEDGAIRISNYTEPYHERMRSKVGQPILQDAFHRSISTIFATCFRNGLCIDGFVEPSYGETQGSSDERGFWSKYPKISPALIVRCRRLPAISTTAEQL